jgi:hypothetical protein
MARSVNIGSIAFLNFRAGKDHIVCWYDDTKSDKTGEMCTGKHIYANLLEPTVSPFLALAVFFSSFIRNRKVVSVRWTYYGCISEILPSSVRVIQR